MILPFIPEDRQQQFYFAGFLIFSRSGVSSLVVSPPSRSFVVEKDDRILEVAGDNRILEVELDDRIFVVKPDPVN